MILYEWTCECGCAVLARSSQAGQTVRCGACSRRIALPPLSQLQSLPYVDEEQSTPRSPFQFDLRRAFKWMCICSVASAFVGYFRPEVVLPVLPAFGVMALFGYFVSPAGRRLVHFIWDAALGVEPRR